MMDMNNTKKALADVESSARVRYFIQYMLQLQAQFNTGLRAAVVSSRRVTGVP